jgi:hypothetical protein
MPWGGVARLVHGQEERPRLPGARVWRSLDNHAITAVLHSGKQRVFSLYCVNEDGGWCVPVDVKPHMRVVC